MNNKLYIGNLPFSAEEQQLHELFGGDGRQVISVKIMMDRETGRSRGFAFIEMGSPEDAQKALQVLQGHDFQGRPLAINEARDQPPRIGGGGFVGASAPRPSVGGGSGLPRPNGPGVRPVTPSTGVTPSAGVTPSVGAPSGNLPRPNGPGGPPPRPPSDRGGFGGGRGGPGGGGGFAGASAPPENPEGAEGGGRGRAPRDHNRGKDRDRDRRNRGGDDW